MSYTNGLDKPSDYFNTKLYTGTGATNNSVTGVGFQPDFIWIKSRSLDGTSHVLQDSIRPSYAYLQTNTTDAENTNSLNNWFKSIDSDGFTVSTSSDSGTSTNEWYEVRTRNLYVNGSSVTSDDRLKHNEEEVVDALGTINKLKLYKYDKTGEMLDADFNGDLGDIEHRKEIGFIAQEVAEIPELAFLVSGGGTAEVEIEKEKSAHGIDEEPIEVPKETRTVELPYNLNYQGITNVAIQAIQELDAKCKSQQDVITSLIARIEALENAS